MISHLDDSESEHTQPEAPNEQLEASKPEPRSKSIIIIPARMASHRLPGKPLLEAGGKSLIQWVYKAAIATNADTVLVATPDKEIARHCRDHGIPAWPTGNLKPNGTSRCLEVVLRMKPEERAKFDIVINWQCDVLAKTKTVNDLIKTHRNRSYGIATVVAPINFEDLNNLSVVKVVCPRGEARWFSRAPMGGSMHHVGIYSFKRETLEKVGYRKPTPLSQAESLEQLTWIEHLYPITTMMIDQAPISINTRTDYEKWKKSVERGEHEE